MYINIRIGPKPTHITIGIHMKANLKQMINLKGEVFLFR
jgi:hypothetical protein